MPPHSPALPCILCRALLCTLSSTQVGNRLRVDGTLMGLDEGGRKAFIPRWKRGRFSLLVNGGARAAEAKQRLGQRCTELSPADPGRSDAAAAARQSCTAALRCAAPCCRAVLQA